MRRGGDARCAGAAPWRAGGRARGRQSAHGRWWRGGEEHGQGDEAEEAPPIPEPVLLTAEDFERSVWKVEVPIYLILSNLRRSHACGLRRRTGEGRSHAMLTNAYSYCADLFTLSLSLSLSLSCVCVCVCVCVCDSHTTRSRLTNCYATLHYSSRLLSPLPLSPSPSLARSLALPPSLPPSPSVPTSLSLSLARSLSSHCSLCVP